MSSRSRSPRGVVRSFVTLYGRPASASNGSKSRGTVKMAMPYDPIRASTSGMKCSNDQWYPMFVEAKNEIERPRQMRHRNLAGVVNRHVMDVVVIQHLAQL